ncbi:MAG: hypothetical protein CMC10_08390 [Flavobacteriaceae bacterium]|nr:hypothetical protein [Flavobacteriaceae bacterium]|tara:strand:+ start:1690 stop:2427 length:738 start_codon:yes stop_codon:yes gene_type:complete
MKKIIFKKIKFLSLNENEFFKIIKKNGLFVFPSGPGLSSINKDNIYLKALQNSDYVFFDSGYFVLLLNLLKNIKVKKFSGYLFIKLFLSYLENKEKKLLLINPNKKLSISYIRYLKKIGIKPNMIFNYIAPFYDTKKLHDKKLLRLVNKIKPDYILINIGGGIQEVLGSFLKKNIRFKKKIFCTGAAIAFLTSDQAPLSYFIDKIYLGWLFRIIFNPKIFLPRYLKSFSLISIVQNEKIKVISNY